MEELFPMISTDRKLHDENYLLWKRIVEISLKWPANQEFHFTGDLPTPVTEQWRCEDAGIYHQMMNTMETDVMVLVIHPDTVKDVWVHLGLIYACISSPSRKYRIFHKMVMMEQGDRSAAEFVADHSKVHAEFRLLYPDTDDFDQMKLQQDELIGFAFLCCFLPKHDVARYLKLGGEMVLSLDEMIQLIMLMHPEPEASQCTMPQGPFGAADGRGGRRRGFKDTRVCNYCGKKGHTQATYWKLHGKLTRLVDVATVYNSSPQTTGVTSYGSWNEEDA